MAGKCRDCGKTIFRESIHYCFYCWNKEKIEAGGFKPGVRKSVEKWKEWNGK
ncbi:MAG: hypothetical protein KJ600_01250 [Nanoarchaeota archaeon]|nr:hypothetical protein [Nanoarchaeota archaeon]MBU1103169.1 hypothetical protein [Nanoarchaeota archaeon]